MQHSRQNARRRRPSFSERTPCRAPVVDFCSSQPARQRSPPERGSPRRKAIRRGRCASSSALLRAATNFVAHAPNDGYTLLQGTVANTINPVITPNLGFDFVKDFTPIALFATLPNIVVVHPSLGVHTVQELIKLAREKPGQLSFGSAGVGGTSHFTGELFNVMAGTNLVHVPYPG